MRIVLRILPSPGAKAALGRDSEIAAACDLDAVVFELDSDSELFGRVLEVTHDTAGSFLNPVMSFTKAELDRSRFFQLEGRKLARESDRDYEMNAARLEELDFVPTYGGMKVKLLDRVALTRIALKDDGIALAGDWTAEFVVGSKAARAFAAEGLEGYELLPVLNPKSGKNHAGFYHLYSESLMPPAVLDPTTPEQAGGDGDGPRELGCLTYELGDGHRPDFNRTAENWSSNFMPLWVVSARVRQAVGRHKLKGWAFRPILEAGSELHETYLAKWQELLGRAAVNPHNTF